MKQLEAAVTEAGCQKSLVSVGAFQIPGPSPVLGSMSISTDDSMSYRSLHPWKPA